MEYWCITDKQGQIKIDLICVHDAYMHAKSASDNNPQVR